MLRTREASGAGVALAWVHAMRFQMMVMMVATTMVAVMAAMNSITGSMVSYFLGLLCLSNSSNFAPRLFSPAISPLRRFASCCSSMVALAT